MFNQSQTFSGSDQWVTNYKNDYPYQDVRFVSPRYNRKEVSKQTTPRVTGRRHFPDSTIAQSSIQFGNEAERDSDIQSRMSGYSGNMHSKQGTPMGTPRSLARLTASVQPPWGVQFRNVVPITVYQSCSIPASAAVGMVARILGLRMNYVEVNTIAGEQQSENFRKSVNPTGTLPVINDEGFKLFEMRAILRYLVTKYGYKNNSLYPSDLVSRARVDTWLDFDLGTLNPVVNEYVAPSLVSQLGSQQPESAEERLQKLESVLDHLNAQLQLSPYICGTQLTIADISIASTLALLDSVRFQLGTNRSSLASWMLRMKGNRQFQDSFASYYAILGSISSH